ncbi:MAG: HD domain-containing protein [Treponema sp.]|jgi:HD superfamily phosphohydrolase|nr:HD domain-containing protein [Treponema sp.]
MDALSALTSGYSEPVRDPLWGHVYLTPSLAALLESPQFMRLFRIFQLGPAYHAYPGATHTRASHSIGVYHLSRRLAASLAERGAGAWMSFSGVRSFLCAALLHDLGHFPYTHSLKELPLDSHETLTGRLIATEPVKSLVAAAGADPEFTAAIVDTSIDCEDTELLFYRRLLSGVLDPDKLDYLNRDARYCGVSYGAQDVDFIFSRLLPDRDRGIDIDSRGIPSVESVLFSKYLMYRTVYWHRQVRSATAMIKKALLAGLGDRTIAGEDLYGLDDQSLFKLMEEKKNPLFRLAGDVKNGTLYFEAAAFPFDETKHRNLLDITGRHLYEEALAAETARQTGKAAAGIIIDLPEPVSLESALYVRDESCIFSQSSSAFSESTVRAFEKSLRIVRIFSPVKAKIPDSVLHNYEKWLHL